MSDVRIMYAYMMRKIVMTIMVALLIHAMLTQDVFILQYPDVAEATKIVMTISHALLTPAISREEYAAILIHALMDAHAIPRQVFAMLIAHALMNAL
jgi:hypothetical protein